MSGFDWNRYNKTHYDPENPPPKYCQGYRFNVRRFHLLFVHSIFKFLSCRYSIRIWWMWRNLLDSSCSNVLAIRTRQSSISLEDRPTRMLLSRSRTTSGTSIEVMATEISSRTASSKFGSTTRGLSTADKRREFYVYDWCRAFGWTWNKSVHDNSDGVFVKLVASSILIKLVFLLASSSILFLCPVMGHSLKRLVAPFLLVNRTGFILTAAALLAMELAISLVVVNKVPCTFCLWQSSLLHQWPED